MINIREACKRAISKKEVKNEIVPSNREHIDLYLVDAAPIKNLIEKWIVDTAGPSHNKIKLKVKDDKTFTVSIFRQDKTKKLYLDESLTFENKNECLEIVDKFKERGKCSKMFDCELISATIHQGSRIGSGHYYILKKFSSSWKKINDDKKVTTHKWNDIKNTVEKHATLLLYKLQ